MEENSKWERGSEERGRKGGARGRARDNGACHEGPANPDFPVPVSRRRLLIYTKRRWAGWKTAARTPRMATHTGSTRHGFWRLDTRSRCQRGVWELTGPLCYKTSLAPRLVTRGIFHKPPPPLPTPITPCPLQDGGGARGAVRAVAGRRGLGAAVCGFLRGLWCAQLAGQGVPGRRRRLVACWAGQAGLGRVPGASEGMGF